MTTDALIKPNYHHGSLREALIAAAILRLQADGIAKLSLRGLAADVGVSPTAVYRHFEDKLALLAAIACDGFTGLTRNMHSYLGAEPTDAMTALQRIGVGYIDYAIHHPAHYRLMFGQRMVERQRFPDLCQTSVESFAMLRNNMQRGLDEKLFKPLPVELLTTTAWSLVHGLSMLSIDGLVNYPSNENLDLLAQTVTRLLADGLLLPEHQHLSLEYLVMTEQTVATAKKSGLAPSTIRIGKRYRASRLEGNYDAIVIGSGIGGLTAAACLSSLGYKVAVMEQHYTAGGFTHSYSRNGYEWDVGVHYIGDVGVKTTLARRLFDFISNDQLQWQAMDPCYDRIHLGDDHFDLVAGRDNFRNNLVNRFPQEQAAIDEYIVRLGKVADAMQAFTIERILPNKLAKLTKLVSNRLKPAYFNQPTRQVLEELTSNQTLIAYLTGQWGDNGMMPAESSFLIHALIAKHYLYGGYYPIGGASRMAETIIPQIQKTGGEVFTYAAVDRILLEKGKAVGVCMKDGTEICSPIVISNAGVVNTFTRLLPTAVSDFTGYSQKLNTVKPSMASLCLYIGIKDTAENLQLPKTNFWIYPNENYEQSIRTFLADANSDIPMVYISFPSAKDPSFSERYPDRSTIEIVAPCPWEWVEQWADKPWGKRGDDYEALKESFSQRLLEKLYEKMPHLRGKVDYYELSTPLSTQFFCWYEKGEIYGLDHDPKRFEQTWLRPKTDIDGLYLTGQDIMTCGVVGAMIGGLMTAVSVGGLKALPLAKKIFAG